MKPRIRFYHAAFGHWPWEASVTSSGAYGFGWGDTPALAIEDAWKNWLWRGGRI